MRLYCTREVHETGGPGLFVLGRVEEQLPRLLKQYKGKVQLIYLDPPMGAGDYMTLPAPLGGQKVPLAGENLSGDAYIKWMRTILMGCQKLLSPEGSLYLHTDCRLSPRLRLLLDEIFGAANFMDEIIWAYKSGGRATRFYPRRHDTILFYRKSRRVYFNIDAVGKPRGPEKRNHMKQFVDETGRVGFSIRSRGKLYTYYEDDPVYPCDVWTDIDTLQSKDKERQGFASQKPEALLERIVLASSREGDLVCDLFSGSGTTAAVAARLKRSFLAVDASPMALLTLRKRLLKQSANLSLLESDASASSLTLQFPSDRCKCVVRCTTEGHGEKRFLLLQEAMLGHTTAPLAYIATGTVTEGGFQVYATAVHPKLPARLSLPPGDTPVLQVVNASGVQAFVTING